MARRPKKRQKSDNSKNNNEAICKYCEQRLDEVKEADIPDNAQNELVTIKDADLLIEGADEEDGLEFNLQNFQIYCRKNHLVPIKYIDDKTKEFFFCGEVTNLTDKTDKAVMTRSAKIENAYINHSQEILMLSTSLGDYNVKRDPLHPLYQHLFKEHMHLIRLVKCITMRCENAYDSNENLRYEDLLQFILEDEKGFTEEDIFNHLAFIVDHLNNYENTETDEADDFTMKDFPAIRHLFHLGGLHISQSKNNDGALDSDNDDYEEDMDSGNDKSSDENFKQENTFESNASIDSNTGKVVKPKNKKKPPGKPVFTTPLVRDFINTDRKKEYLNSDYDCERRSRSRGCEFQPGEKIRTEKGLAIRKYLMFAWGMVETGSYVKINDPFDECDIKNKFGQVINVFTKSGQHMVHFQRLTEEAVVDKSFHKHGNELFKKTGCEVVLAQCISKASIKFRPQNPFEFRNGYKNETELQLEDLKIQENQEKFWRFLHDDQVLSIRYPTKSEENPTCYCKLAHINHQDSLDADISFEDDKITGFTLAGFTVEKNKFYYLTDNASTLLGLKYNYPEIFEVPKTKFRQTTKFLTKKEKILDPFIVIQVKDWSNDEVITLRILYRPENTNKPDEETRQEHLSCLYLSREDTLMDGNILGRYLVTTCTPTVVYGTDVEELASWCHLDPHRFYTNHKYDKSSGLKPINALEARKHKIRHIDDVIVKEREERTADAVTPLRTLDIYSGAGGLSTGLEESGVAKVLWAVENNEMAAQAFQNNHSEAKVFTRCCNDILEELVMGLTSSDVAEMPARGQVDMIVGGPPCQGFSKLNHARDMEPSKLKNNQVYNFLGYVDYYRPRFVLMENVKNFVYEGRHEYFNTMIATLVHMGYQVNAGILQAGQYMIAQWRRRFFLLAAAPGEKLPLFPEPVSVFPAPIYIDIDKYKHKTLLTTNKNPGAPRRMLTTWDVIGDLPAIESSNKDDEMDYRVDLVLPMSKLYFRNEGAKLYDHVCSSIGDKNQMRLDHLPSRPGADWRDLPNIDVQLKNEKLIRIKYETYLTKNGDLVEGVCPCIADPKGCTSRSAKRETFIPFFLVHTAHKRRFKNWEGLCGRVPWDGHFPTTLTNPSLFSKQGTVVHPDQNRICSVREMARSQGFKDTFRFVGNAKDKYRQIGNAVPPPLAKAIGLEIRKCLIDREDED